MRALSHFVEVMEMRMKNEVKADLTVKQTIRKIFEMVIDPEENLPKDV